MSMWNESTINITTYQIMICTYHIIDSSIQAISFTYCRGPIEPNRQKGKSNIYTLPPQSHRRSDRVMHFNDYLKWLNAIIIYNIIKPAASPAIAAALETAIHSQFFAWFRFHVVFFSLVSLCFCLVLQVVAFSLW